MLAKLISLLFPKPDDWSESLAYQERCERTRAWQYRNIPFCK